MAPKSNHLVATHRVVDWRRLAVLLIALVLAFLLGTGGFQIYWSK